MSGPGDVAIDKMSNFEAGLAFLGVLNQLYPGIRFNQLRELAAGREVETMGGFSLNPMDAFRSIKKVVGDIKDGAGDILKDTFDAVADKGGDAVRLATDEKVVNGATQLYSNYLTGGLNPDELMNFVTNLGAQTKAKAAAASGALPGGILPWALGAGGLVLVLVMTGRR